VVVVVVVVVLESLVFLLWEVHIFGVVVLWVSSFWEPRVVLSSIF